MSAICVERWMRLHVPTFSPFCGLMCQDPLLIREKLFQGIDKDYNVVDMGIVSEVIGELESFHITKEALEATRLGKHINELRRKSSDRLLANRAKSLVKKWRALLSGPETGPPPGGGNNNNSLAATNGNTASRLNAAVALSPGLPLSNISPGIPMRNNISPGLPMRNNISPGLPMRNNLSPGMRNNLSPGMRPCMTPGIPQRQGSIPNSLSGGFRSARASPSVSRSATPRVSPATVTISSSGSSPSNSRPSSPHTFRPINPPGPSLPNSRSPSPDIEIIDEVVKTPRVLTNHKRMRREDSDVRLDNKRPKLDFGHQTQNLNGIDGIARDGVISSSDRISLANRPKKHVSRSGSENKNMLKKQITMAKQGKVKTTQELLENLGIESRHVVSPPVPHNMNNLVPNENKEELMNRFFESQLVNVEDEDEDAVQVISRPPTAAGTLPSSVSNSAVSSRVQTPAAIPPLQSIEDVLAQLPPIDPTAVLAEWEARMEDEEEIEGLIPVFKPKLEITEKVIQDLNEGQLEYIGGVTDHAGEFREWHEMASKETLNGEILHVLPYSLID